MGFFDAIGDFFEGVADVVSDIGEAVVGAVEDVVTAPFKLIKEGVEFVGHLVQLDFKAAFQDLTQAIGPALTIVSTVATAGAGGIVINSAKQIGLNVAKKVAINAGGEVLGDVLGAAGVDGPVAGALVGVAQSYAGGGFKMDAETLGKTAGKAVLAGAAQTDGTLGDIARVGSVAMGVADTVDGGFKGFEVSDYADLALTVGQSGLLGEDVQAITGAADGLLTGLYAAKQNDGRVDTKEALALGLTTAQSGALGEEVQDVTLAADLLIEGIEQARRNDGKVDVQEAAVLGLATAQSGILGDDAQTYGNALSAIHTGVGHVRDGADPLEELTNLAEEGAFGRDAAGMTQVISAMARVTTGPDQAKAIRDEMLDLSAQGVFGRETQQLAQIVSASRADGGVVKGDALLKNVLLTAATGNYGDNAALLSRLLLSVGVSFGDNDNAPFSSGVRIAS